VSWRWLDWRRGTRARHEHRDGLLAAAFAAFAEVDEFAVARVCLPCPLRVVGQRVGKVDGSRPRRLVGFWRLLAGMVPSRVMNCVCEAPNCWKTQRPRTHTRARTCARTHTRSRIGSDCFAAGGKCGAA